MRKRDTWVSPAGGGTEQLMGTGQVPVVFHSLLLSAVLCLRAEPPDPPGAGGPVAPILPHVHAGGNTRGKHADERMRPRDNLTSGETHAQPCRKTGRRETGRRAGRPRSDTQCPQAAGDIAAPLNSIMTVSSTSRGPKPV